ncbi:MAG: hypothetical protein J1F31_05135 [Erysipelotrichales bacterium]|nr:hypothetical protein [Erysipelotrichales bacterium]
MKKVCLLISLFMLVSCSVGNKNSNATNDSTNSVEGEISTSLANSTDNSTESDISTSLPNSSDSIDYSLFDTNLIGTWYIHSGGVLPLNTTIEIFDNYTLVIQNVRFNFVGLYAGFDGACEFINDIGIVVASFDGAVVDWAFSGIDGTQDMGVARRTPYTSGLNYDYIGKDWPMELINSYLGTSGMVPSIESVEYYLWRGTSSLYDAKSCMIDVFDASDDAINNYIELLENADYTFTKQDNIGFHYGYDPNHIYGLKIKDFGKGNVSIFIYNYQVLFG